MTSCNVTAALFLHNIRFILQLIVFPLQNLCGVTWCLFVNMILINKMSLPQTSFSAIILNRMENSRQPFFFRRNQCDAAVRSIHIKQTEKPTGLIWGWYFNLDQRGIVRGQLKSSRRSFLNQIGHGAFIAGGVIGVLWCLTGSETLTNEPKSMTSAVQTVWQRQVPAEMSKVGMTVYANWTMLGHLISFNFWFFSLLSLRLF